MTSLDKLAMLLFDIQSGRIEDLEGSRTTMKYYSLSSWLPISLHSLSTVKDTPLDRTYHFTYISTMHWPLRSNQFAHQPRFCYYYLLSMLEEDGGSRRRKSRTTEALSLLPLAGPKRSNSFGYLSNALNTHYEKRSRLEF